MPNSHSTLPLHLTTTAKILQFLGFTEAYFILQIPTEKFEKKKSLD